jgi:hypothetical protein
MRTRKQPRRAKKRPASSDDADNDSFYSTEYDDAGTSSARMPDFSRNPIIAILQGSLRRRGVQVTALSGHKSSDGEMRRFIEAVFDDETIHALGLLQIAALLDCDQRFVQWVTQALKESKHVFNRDRELVLFEAVFKFVHSDSNEHKDVATIKKEIEKRFNKGQPFEQYRWNRLRKALLLPKLPTGRPKKSNTKPRQTVY